MVAPARLDRSPSKMAVLVADDDAFELRGMNLLGGLRPREDDF